jgi:HPt (histidine-containing phosphotransfer) domain-containing protein
MALEADIDMRALERLRKLGGNELLAKMVSLFTSQAEPGVREAATALSSGDFDGVQRAAHSLKSSAGNLGAQKVQDIADQIEQLAEQRSGEISALLTDLERAYLRAKDRLLREVKEGELI